MEKRTCTGTSGKRGKCLNLNLATCLFNRAGGICENLCMKRSCLFAPAQLRVGQKYRKREGSGPRLRGCACAAPSGSGTVKFPRILGFRPATCTLPMEDRLRLPLRHSEGPHRVLALEKCRLATTFPLTELFLFCNVQTSDRLNISCYKCEKTYLHIKQFYSVLRVKYGTHFRTHTLAAALVPLSTSALAAASS